MNKILWDGKMDYGWEGLSTLLLNTCERFTDDMLGTTQFSPSSESKELISSECMERFGSIIGILADIVEDGGSYEYEDLEGEAQNALKLNGWILLGSLTETVLQMFLAFYIDDYKNTKWQQWEIAEKEQVQKPIIECIQQLVDGKVIDAEQAKSLKKAIKDTIREHTREHDVQKVMLDELIQLYMALDLLDEDEIFYLRSIQSSRNGIHSFQHREIGNWCDFQYSVRFFCYLMDWIMFRLPDIPDYELEY